jgi:hypothetical protein
MRQIPYDAMIAALEQRRDFYAAAANALRALAQHDDITAASDDEVIVSPTCEACKNVEPGTVAAFACWLLNC